MTYNEILNLIFWIHLNKIIALFFFSSLCSGFPENQYCPRMATMNKPAYQAIKSYSPDRPVLIFVSSRRQTRLTALDLIGLCGVDDNPKQFVKIHDEGELRHILSSVTDDTLKRTLEFGVGMHHAGMTTKWKFIYDESDDFQESWELGVWSRAVQNKGRAIFQIFKNGGSI